MQNLHTPPPKKHNLRAKNLLIVLSQASSKRALRSCVGARDVKSANEPTPEKRLGLTRSSSAGKRLDPALKSWLDNVIIPALVREYMAEIKKRNRLATTGPSEVTSDKDGIQS